MNLRILGCHIRRDVLIEELQNEWNTIGKDEVLWNKFKLVHMINFSMFEEKDYDSGNSFDDDFLVSGHVNS